MSGDVQGRASHAHCFGDALRITCFLWPDMQYDDSNKQQEHEQAEEDQARRLHWPCSLPAYPSSQPRIYCVLSTSCTCVRLHIKSAHSTRVSNLSAGCVYFMVAPRR